MDKEDECGKQASKNGDVFLYLCTLFVMADLLFRGRMAYKNKRANTPLHQPRMLP